MRVTGTAIFRSPTRVFLVIAFVVFIVSIFTYFGSQYFNFSLPFIGNQTSAVAIQLENGSQAFQIQVRNNKLMQYVKDSDLHGITNIYIATSDQIQAHRYAWGPDDVFASLSVRVVGTNKYITIHVDIQRMREAGWSENMIAREISSLILQGTILNQNLYTTSQMVQDAKDKSIEIMKNNNNQPIVMLK